MISQKKAIGLGAFASPTTLLSAAAFMMIGVGFLGAGANQKPILHDAAARMVRKDINATRARAKLQPLAEHRILQERAELGALALARAVLENSKKLVLPEELSEAQLRAALTDAAGFTLQAGSAASPEQIAEQALGWRVAKLKDMTHLGVGLCNIALDSGQIVWVLVAIAAKILPEMDADLLNRGEREFHMKCHLCGHEFNAKLRKPLGKNTGSLQVICPSCRLRFDVFGIDEQGRYHRPPWFMRGFKPAGIKDPLFAWLFVLNHCRYVRDAKLFGREEVWQLAEYTYRRRRGDCEDMAILLGDWLTSSGFQARVVLGQVHKQGHAWVVLHRGGRDYILEATGRLRNHRRVPPRAAVLPMYFPRVQFDSMEVWFRKAEKWTAKYFDAKEWSPWPRSMN